jgi:hypothetical protein
MEQEIKFWIGEGLVSSPNHLHPFLSRLHRDHTNLFGLLLLVWDRLRRRRQIGVPRFLTPPAPRSRSATLEALDFVCWLRSLPQRCVCLYTVFCTSRSRACNGHLGCDVTYSDPVFQPIQFSYVPSDDVYKENFRWTKTTDDGRTKRTRPRKHFVLYY